jgi:SAM-dependent methyltransferase
LAQFWRDKRFMLPTDIPLFLKSAKADAAIARWQQEHGSRAAFDAAYSTFDDPWQAASPKYRYQSWKYDHLIESLPGDRRFKHALDLGCGLGLLTSKLAEVADRVTGIDIADEAIARAARRTAGLSNIAYQQGDASELPRSLNGQFDLVVIADTLYYLPPPITAAALKRISMRIGELLVPGGVCLLANHYFFSMDRDSRLSRTIHNAFIWSPAFEARSQHRRPFYLVTLLDRSN